MLNQLLVTALAATLVTATTTLPLAIAILRSRDPARGCAAVLFVHGILLVLGIGLISALSGSAPPVGALVINLGMIGPFLATQAGVLMVARSHGIRLATSSRRDPSERPASLPDSGA
jgi:hypothetical protein